MMGLPDMPPGLANQAEQILTDLAAWCTANQPGYYQQHGHYWQGLQTPSQIPVDGQVAAIEYSRRPSDQAESWGDLAVTLPPQTPIALAVDVYAGPQGAGYQIFAVVELAGVRWEKCLNVGPAAEGGFDWTQAGGA